MVTFYEANGFDEFTKILNSLKKKDEPIFVYFAGSQGADGKSWCPDCESAHSVVYSAMKTLAPENAHFLHVQVGDKEAWKDKECVFRKNPTTRLTLLPTMRRWGTPYILVEDECRSVSLVEMLLKEEP